MRLVMMLILLAMVPGLMSCGQTSSNSGTTAGKTSRPPPAAQSADETDSGATSGDETPPPKETKKKPTKSAAAANDAAAGDAAASPAQAAPAQPAAVIEVDQATITLKRADLLIKYGAYTDGDGNSDSATQTYDLKSPFDKDFQPLQMGPFVPEQASNGSLKIAGACLCGQVNHFELRWHATGSKGNFDGTLDQADPKMFYMAHAISSSTGGHWKDNDFLAGAPSGLNTLYLSNDHGGSSCAVPYFDCGSDSPDSMDDVRLIMQCDLSACGDDAAKTELYIKGQDSHMH